VKKIKAYGERALPNKVRAHNESEKIVALVRETFAETGRKLVPVGQAGQYGWNGELELTYYGFMTPFWELQACKERRAETLEGAIALAEKCISQQENPEIYQIVHP
jgi:hypothetical protein